MLKPTARVQRIKGPKAGALARVASLLPGPDRVKVGVPDGELADIASYNEFGTRAIPERPAFRNAMRANRSKYAQAMKAGAREVIAAAVRGGDVTAVKRSVLARMGAMAEADIKAEITSLDSPPNAPSTIRKKGSSKPLVDTGRLRASVTHQVED